MDIIKEQMLGITAEIADSVEFSFSEVHINHGAYFWGENNFTAYISVLPLEIELLIEGGFDERTVTIALEICTPDGEIIANDFSTIQSPKENARKTITPYLDAISSRFITEIKNKKQSPSAE